MRLFRLEDTWLQRNGMAWMVPCGLLLISDGMLKAAPTQGTEMAFKQISQ